MLAQRGQFNDNSPMPALLDILSSYIPPPVARRFVDHPTPLAEPQAQRFPAAVLFADISGFTELTEVLARRGSAGTEALSQLLNDYFGELIDLITGHGGEVVKFAGDGLLALWPAGDEDLATATLRAAQCSIGLQGTLHNYQTESGMRLSLHIGISAGEVLTAHIGGLFGRWEFLVTGEPLVEMSLAERQAQPGQTILAPSAWKLVADRCAGQKLALGGALLEGVHNPVPTRSAAPIDLPAQAEGALRAYIPAAIIARLDAGLIGWLAELRRVSVLFVNLPDLGTTMPLEKSQSIMRALQVAVYTYEGSINQLAVDDKGVTLVAALGLPPLAHEDDPVRAVRSARAVREALDNLGVRCSIGLATGEAFCGAVGSALRREYTMIGDVVNLAARLMQAAASDIFCDDATMQAAAPRHVFETLPAVLVKGKATPVGVFRPKGETQRAQVQTAAPLVGRHHEWGALREPLEALMQGSNGDGRSGARIAIIEGEAGIGKSRLIEEVHRRAETLGITTFAGWGDAVERTSPYHAWRGVFMKLLDAEHIGDPEPRARHVLNLLELEPEWLRLAPLLNPVLSLDLPDNDVTGQMSGEVRANNTRELLVQLLKASATRSPKVVLMEDAHWLDSASWSVLIDVCQRIQPLLVVIAARPLLEPVEEYRQIASLSGVTVLRLEGLSGDEAIQLVCQRLGAKALPRQVSELIAEKAEGHPFFSEELAFALRDAGVLHVEGGECRIAGGSGDLRALIPDTIQAAITSRIDRLDVRQQFTLKVASVIGRIFLFKTLHDVHPLEGEKPHLPEHLDILSKLDITLLEAPAPDLQYIFKHVITREVSYNLMTFDQRRQLHRAVAEWYEHNHAGDLAPHYPLLAHHWGRAEEDDRAVTYLVQAGEQALRSYANQEAIQFLSEALTLDAKAPDRRGSAWRAHVERLIGQAHHNLGNLTEAQKHLRECLRLMGRPVPGRAGRLALATLFEAAAQLAHRLFPPNPARHPPEEKESLRESVQALETLGETHFFANESLPTIYCVFRLMNLAEQTGPSPELARAYARMVVVMGIIPAHRWAEMYLRMARRMASEVNDPLALARVIQITSAYTSGVADWPRAWEGLNSVLSAARQFGDLRMVGDTLSMISMLQIYQADYSSSIATREELNRVTQRSGNLQHRVWYLSGQAQNYLRARRDQLLVVTMEEQAASYLDENREGGVDISVYGILSLGYLRNGKIDAARRAADRALRLITTTSPTLYSVHEGYAAAAEVYLTLWERGIDAGHTMPAAQQVVKGLHGFARRFPVALPRAWLAQGTLDWLAGRHDTAMKSWQKAIREAKRLGIPLDEGLALVEIARHMQPAEPGRRERLEASLAIFRRVGAEYHVEQVRELLG